MKVVNTGEPTTLLGRISRKSGEGMKTAIDRGMEKVTAWKEKPRGNKTHRITVEASFIGLSPVCGGGRDATS